ncbi:hypothetical protein CH63R_10364 [Colletotrichum higginsianum IMI 349063]|uniref:Uncharacterized protein n=2 Tax=Colletotrichum higginsianum TaxID=80884 RepID=A0A1B7Y2L9_COLHI|nr:uncharacterized protein CH63R_10364 [Colletotrichum higginsianum IMI 349063]OBR06244.1 hypothetical protein CH63R_10364 [Colletotrichum higginsianum IMI 349063]TIC96855.1 hypothetical protein CH35J_007198 [Colletotrichum higginsianum]
MGVCGVGSGSTVWLAVGLVTLGDGDVLGGSRRKAAVIDSIRRYQYDDLVDRSNKPPLVSSTLVHFHPCPSVVSLCIDDSSVSLPQTTFDVCRCRYKKKTQKQKQVLGLCLSCHHLQV